MSGYKKPSLTTDVVIFDETISKTSQFILIKRKNNPFKGEWAIPGGFVEYGERVENAAIREIKEETGIDLKLTDLELFDIYSKKNRDPRGHTVTIVYLALGNIKNMRADSDAEEIKSYFHGDISSLKIAFDHRKILADIFEVISNKVISNKAISNK